MQHSDSIVACSNRDAERGRGARPRRTSPNRLLWLITLAFLVPLLAVAADGRNFAGFYQVRTVVDMGDEVALTLAARVFNYSGTSVENASIALEDRVGLNPPYGSVVVPIVPDKHSVRLDIQATVPRAEYEAWQAGGTPRLTIAYVDASGELTVRPIELADGLLED